MMSPQTVVMQFAKAAIAGKVKTRLVPTLGLQGATDLHKALVTHSYERLCNSNWYHLQLWGSEISNNFFTELTSSMATPVYLQQGQDLGEKMSFAIDHALDSYTYAIVIGSDCPAIDDGYIKQAIRALQSGNDVVIGPAEDGGYGLIGVARSCPQIFYNVAWGTDQVLGQTQQHLKNLDWQWTELPAIRDIDDADDLVELEKFPGLFAFSLDDSAFKKA